MSTIIRWNGRMYRMVEGTIAATYEGNCKICRKKIKPGDLVRNMRAPNTKRGKWLHKDCATKLIKESNGDLQHGGGGDAKRVAPADVN